MALTSINPINNQPFAHYEEHDDVEVSSYIDQTYEAWLTWRTTSFDHRRKLLEKAAEVLENNASTYADLMTDEMGKTRASSLAEVKKCAWVCRYYAEHAESFLKDEEISTQMKKSFISHRPIGPVLAVMPWNFPFWQVFRFAAPALMAGNVGLLKHASNVTGCSIAIEGVFAEAGFPEGAFRSLLISSSKVEGVIAHPKVRAVTLTGSTQAGRAVGKAAGYYLKKSVLELGGSDPYVVLADADLAKAAEVCVASRLINAGQSCIAAKRFIVVKEVKEAFTELVLEEMKAKHMGNPHDETSDLGPQAKTSLRDELHEQVLDSIKKGAHCLLGGTIPEKEGAWYPPTLLDHVTPGMPAFDDELFGPVAAIIEAENEEEAFRIANDSVFGLGAAVFTEDEENGVALAKEHLEAGCCFVNGFVKSDPRLPFGGIKESGYGRELSAYGIKEFVNTKTVVLE